MRPKAAALVAGVIDRLEGQPRSTGRPLVPTLKVVEALRFFVREGLALGSRNGGSRPADRMLGSAEHGASCGPLSAGRAAPLCVVA